MIADAEANAMSRYRQDWQDAGILAAAMGSIAEWRLLGNEVAIAAICDLSQAVSAADRLC